MRSYTGSAHGGFGGFWKSLLVELSSASEEESWLSLARRGLVSGAHMMGVDADRNVVIERLCLSLPYVEKPLNSKVIKSFVPELRSRKCFCVSVFLYSMYICYEYSMYVSHIRIMGMVHGWIVRQPVSFSLVTANQKTAVLRLNLTLCRIIHTAGTQTDSPTSSCK